MQQQIVVLATHNHHKIEEFQELLSPLFWDLQGIDFLEAPEETGTTFDENALIKARTACRATGKWALADDSGLCVAALGGEPGVDTANYGGWEKLLAALHGATDRRATFECVLALVLPTGKEYLFRASTPGHIAETGREGRAFGYDPVFIPEGESRAFSEMPLEDKALFSHRAAAVRQLIAWAQHG